MMILTGHPVVDKISQMNFEGNITPNTWFQHIKRQTETKKIYKTDLLAIAILSDLIYWYRASEIRDEFTGKTLKYKKKFKGENYQKWYDSWAETFGVTKRQVQESMKILIDLNLVHREIKTIKTEQGLVLTGVTYFSPILQSIEYINIPESENHKPLFLKHTPYGKTGGVLRKKEGGATEKREATEITTEITTENKKNFYFVKIATGQNSSEKEGDTPSGSEGLAASLDKSSIGSNSNKSCISPILSKKPKIQKISNPFNYSNNVALILNHWKLKGGKVAKNPNMRKKADNVAGLIEELLLPGRNEYLDLTDDLELRMKQWTVKEIISCIDLYTTKRDIADWFFDSFICYRFNKYHDSPQYRNKKDFSALLETYAELDKEPTETEKYLTNEFFISYPDTHIYSKVIKKVSDFIDQTTIDYEINDPGCSHDLAVMFLQYVKIINQTAGNCDYLSYMGTEQNLKRFLLIQENAFHLIKRTPEEKAEYLRMKPIWEENKRKALEQSKIFETLLN